MLLFYAPDISSGTCTLPEDESRHCVRVLRLAVGDTVHLTDGRGVLYTAQITSADAKHCVVTVTGREVPHNVRSYYLHLAVAPTKNIDRYEHMLEKVTETGVQELTPLVCARSERRTVNTARLEKVLVAAMKQSLQTQLPRLHSAAGFAELLQQPFDGEKYIACCSPDIPRELFWQALPAGRRALVLIGPEGDFSDEEVQAALQAGFRPVTFGNTRFRTETAAMIAAFAMYAGDPQFGVKSCAGIYD